MEAMEDAGEGGFEEGRKPTGTIGEPIWGEGGSDEGRESKGRIPTGTILNLLWILGPVRDYPTPLHTSLPTTHNRLCTKRTSFHPTDSSTPAIRTDHLPFDRDILQRS